MTNPVASIANQLGGQVGGPADLSVLGMFGKLSAAPGGDPIPDFGEALDLPVVVNVLDPVSETVMRAEITMRVSSKGPQR